MFLLSFKLPEIEQSDEKLKFDGVGVALAATGLFLFLVGVSRISAWGLVEPFPACPFTIAGISPCLPMAVLGVIILIVEYFQDKKTEPQLTLKSISARARVKKECRFSAFSS